MTNQNLVVGNIYHIINITVTTTPTTLAALIGTASGKGVENTVKGRDVLQVTINPGAAILMQDRDNGASHQLGFSTAKTVPVLNSLNQILLSCASSTVAVSLEIISQDPTRT